MRVKVHIQIGCPEKGCMFDARGNLTEARIEARVLSTILGEYADGANEEICDCPLKLVSSAYLLVTGCVAKGRLGACELYSEARGRTYHISRICMLPHRFQ